MPTMSTISQQDVVNHIKQLTVLELSELVKALEDELGVSAAAAMPVAVAAGGGEAAPVEEDASSAAPRNAPRRSRNRRSSTPCSRRPGRTGSR